MMENILMEPVTYYKKEKGKNIRDVLGQIFGLMLGVSQENITLVNNIVSDLHIASLVIDDIEDNSFMRRNIPCAHIKYGMPLSLNAGYFSFFKSLVDISKNFTSDTVNRTLQYCYDVHEGQGMDIYYTQKKIIPSLLECEKMMIYKTGYLFTLQLDLLTEKATIAVDDKYRKILVQFALFYQIRDDYINLTDVDYWKAKGFCQDFDEEKISYLITYFNTIPSEKGKTNVIEMMQDKSKEGKMKILRLFQNSGVFDNIYAKLVELQEQITTEIDLQIIFNQLPFHKFNINDALEFLPV
jgi:geranylgeranyl pyrophosphate synthase